MAHILLVEDNAANAEVATLICEAGGHSVRHAVTGIDAMRKLLAKERFDLVLLDVLMPELDGIDLAIALRGSYSYGALPIVAVTAVTGTRDAKKLREAGVDAIVSKPYKPETLLDAIAKVVTGAPTPENQELQ